MDCYVLDQNFNSIAYIDSFESLIWTDRYNSAGDFELYMAMEQRWLEYLKVDNYLWTAKSEHLMIIEQIYITSDSEDGNHLKVIGKSLESILDRRIVWTQTVYRGQFQDCIKKIIEDAIINPSIPERRIENFVFEESTDPRITKADFKMEAEYTGDNLYDIITTLCRDQHIGYKITLNDQNQFVFKLYVGENRTYEQTVYPYVIFSPGYENLINSSYLDSVEIYKTITLVAGEGEGTARKTTTVGDGNGLLRRELFTDARDISSDTDAGTLTNDQYMELLRQRGVENLDDYKHRIAFEGEAETTQMFVFGKDFFIGDVVQTEDEWGHTGESRIVEFIMSQDNNGLSMYPTFEIVNEGLINEGGNS